MIFTFRSLFSTYKWTLSMSMNCLLSNSLLIDDYSLIYTADGEFLSLSRARLYSVNVYIHAHVLVHAPFFYADPSSRSTRQPPLPYPATKLEKGAFSKLPWQYSPESYRMRKSKEKQKQETACQNSSGTSVDIDQWRGPADFSFFVFEQLLTTISGQFLSALPFFSSRIAL